MEEFTPLTNDRGLYKKILKEGNGPCPAEGSLVKMLYKGILEDGTMFDESDEEGFEFEIGKNEVILGWEVAVKTMKLGEKAVLVLRSDYGYGDAGFMVIPPKAPLIFCVDLIEIKGKDIKKQFLKIE